MWRDQLYDFITQVIGQKVVVVGNSLGGYASLSVSAQRRDAVAGVVLLNSAGPFSDNQPSSSSGSSSSGSSSSESSDSEPLVKTEVSLKENQSLDFVKQSTNCIWRYCGNGCFDND